MSPHTLSSNRSEFDVLEVLPVGIFILDQSLRVAFVNRTMETYFGLSRDQLIGKDKRTLVMERIRFIVERGDEFARRLLASYDDNTYPEHFRCHVLGAKHRRERWLEHRSEPIRVGPYTGGRSELYTDVTAQVESELERNFLHHQVMQIQEREKARVAKDLHDGLGQSTVAVKLMLEGLHGSLQGRLDMESECRRLREVISHVERMSNEIRSISFDLTPSMLHPLGLPDTIAWMADHMEDLYQLKINFACHGLRERRMPASIETPLFRVFQEALNNVAKHAGASEIQLSLIYNHPKVIAVIKDNGCGFDPQTAIEGMGIKSMQHRVQEMGGIFKLQAKVGRGTTIRVEVPVAGELHG